MPISPLDQLDLNKRLIRCVTDQDFYAAKSLIDMGAEVNHTTKDYRHWRWDGRDDKPAMTALHLLCEKGCHAADETKRFDRDTYSTIRMLLENGADPNIYCGHYTAFGEYLSQMAFSGNMGNFESGNALIKRFIAAGAKLNQSTNDETNLLPLFFAVNNHAWAAAKLMLEMGCDINATARDTSTTKEQHRKDGFSVIMKFLYDFDRNFHDERNLELNDELKKHNTKQIDKIAFLLDNGASLDIKSLSGKTGADMMRASKNLPRLFPKAFSKYLIADILTEGVKTPAAPKKLIFKRSV